MKNFIRRSIVLGCIIYLLLSFIINISFMINSNSQLKELEFRDQNELKEETVGIPKDTSVANLIQMNYYSGRLEIVYHHFEVMTIAIFLGIFISMVIILKENSKIKFVLFFIIGNIIFNLFCTSITLFVFQSNGIELDFIEKYINITEHTFIAYTIIYCIFLMIAFLDMKVKIKKINESIKKRE